MCMHEIHFELSIPVFKITELKWKLDLHFCILETPMRGIDLPLVLFVKLQQKSMVYKKKEEEEKKRCGGSV